MRCLILIERKRGRNSMGETEGHVKWSHIIRLIKIQFIDREEEGINIIVIF